MENIIQDWKTNREANKKQNLKFLFSQRNYDNQENIDLVKGLHREAFGKIDCLKCANCCKTSPALLVVEDINRISKHLGISSKQFKKNYVLEDFNGEISLNTIPCHFLNTDNTCSIYDVRPKACRSYPHTDDPKFFNQPKLNTENTIVCPATYYVVERLKNIKLTS